MDPDIARQLDIQKAELAKSFNECAIVLRRTAGVAEHLATVVNHVSFLSSPPEQKSQYLAVLDIANSLSALVPSPNATPAAPSNKRKAGALKEPKEKKEKAAKDPNAPKKPATAYLLYQNKVRANVKAENPEFTNKELMGKIGALWSALPDNEKQPYHDAVTKAREQYAKDVSEYEENKEGGAAAPADASVISAPKKKDIKEKPKKLETKKASPPPPLVPAKPKTAPPPESSEEGSEEESSDDDDEEEDEEEEDEPPKQQKKKQKLDSTPASKPIPVMLSSTKKAKEKK